MSEEDGVVVFLSIGNEDVVIDLVTAERSKRIKNVLLFELEMLVLIAKTWKSI